MSIPNQALPRVNVGIAWKRMYAMLKPMTPVERYRLNTYKVISVLTWPALALFGRYTLDMDYPEHAARHTLVNKKMPYMNNPGNIVYKWGHPCTLLDYECHYEHRKSQN